MIESCGPGDLGYLGPDSERMDHLVACRDDGAFAGQDIILFWRPSGRGYTCDVDQAARFTKEGAEAIQKSTHGVHLAVPESSIEGKLFRVVRRDDVLQITTAVRDRDRKSARRKAGRK